MFDLNFYIITHFLTAIISLFISYIVFFKNRKSVTHITLSLFSFFIFWWSASYSIWLLSSNETQALFWSRMLNLGATFIPIFLLHWLVSFLGVTKKRKILVIFYYIVTAFFVLFTFSDYYVWGVAKLGQFIYWPQIGFMYILFLLVCWIPIFFYAFFLLIKELRDRKSSARQQILYVLLGLVIGFLGGSTNYLLMFGFDLIPPIPSALVVVFPIFFSYAIVRHRLMDIKLVMRKSSVFLASIVTIIILAIIANHLSSIFVSNAVDWVVYLTILVLSLVFFPSIRKFYYRLANKYFFSSLYDSQEVIANMSEKLRSTLEVQKIYDFVFSSLSSAFHFKYFGILGYDHKTESYLIRYNRGFKVGRKMKFPGNKVLHKMFIRKNEPIITEEVKNEYYNPSTKETINLLNKLKVEILAPLNIKNKTVGLIALGPKESGDMYNEEDLQVLRTIGAFAAISIDHALQYKKTLSFNIRLKQEVEKATEELRKANRELKKLDVAKSEFISIASHQLRTPLTVIKGYVSMMIEGSFGELTPEEKSSLNKIYESNERLIQLVENLLNISRIESGRLQFDFKEMQLEKLTDSVMEELSDSAKKKGLKLNYKKPDELLPKTKIDEEKLRQVVMNLIDNAIKYTKKGNVTVTLKKVGKRIQFCVSDSGMGITKDDLGHLFKKFSRGEGTSVVHTEGTGLGLYVAKEMIEAHHGKIWAESEGDGKGASFYFELPIK